MAEERSRAGTSRDPQKLLLDSVNAQLNKMTCNNQQTNFNRGMNFNGNINPFQVIQSPFSSRPMMP